MNIKRSAFMPVIFLLAACSHEIPAHQAIVTPEPQPATVRTVQTTPSGQTIVTIPAHQATAPVAAVIPAPRSTPPVSVLPLTLTGDLTPIENMVRTAMPDSFNEIGHPLSSDFRWSFSRIGDPHVSIHDGVMTVRADYSGSIETKGVTARACRLNPVYPVVEETAQLDVRQHGDNTIITMVNPQMRVWLKPESDARCNMFNTPLQEQVRELINADLIHARLASAVEHTGMRIRTNVGESLNGPFAYSMQPTQSELCLYPTPSQITVGTFEGNQREAVLRTMAVVSPTAIVGRPCPAAPAAAVPMRAGTVPSPQPLTIVSGVLLPYDALTDMVQNRLRSAEFPLSDGQTIRIDRVRARDAYGKVLFEVDASGYLNGTLYFWGTPELQMQPSTGRTVLAIPDLRLDPESMRMLDSIDQGLGMTVDQKMSGRIREASRVDLTDRIAMVQNAVAVPHQAGDMVVTFTPVRLQPGYAYSTSDGVVTDVTMEATGNAVGKFYIIQG